MGCNSNNFKERIKKGEVLQKELEDYLTDNKIPYAKTGYENLISENNFSGIKYNKDNTSEFIRFYPDYATTFSNNSFLIEAKNSSGIEYNCYKAYKSLAENLGLKILLFLKNKKLCKLSDLILKTDKHDKISNMEIPFIDGTPFRDPHLLNPEQYRQYIDAYKNAQKWTSGNAFAFIDFETTVFYDLDILLKYKGIPNG